jgi:hypothetical protein
MSGSSETSVHIRYMESQIPKTEIFILAESQSKGEYYLITCNEGSTLSVTSALEVGGRRGGRSENLRSHKIQGGSNMTGTDCV